MAKKKTYQPSKNDNWNEEASKEHRRIIAKKEKEIRDKYKKWWDSDIHQWKDGFNGHQGTTN